MASPLPIGFFATAIATSMVACLELNIFKAADHQAVAYVMLSAFVLQIIVAIAALAARDTLVASLMATFAGAWLVDGLISLTSPLGSQHVLAAYFIIFSLFLVMMAQTIQAMTPMPMMYGAASTRSLNAAAMNPTATTAPSVPRSWLL